MRLLQIGLFIPDYYGVSLMSYYQRLLAVKQTLYLTPEQFLADAVEYFEWCVDHPLLEDVTFAYQGIITHDDKSKVRAFTKTGLANFLSIPSSRLATYKKRGDAWAEAAELVEEAIYTQKFENAAAGLLNSAIIIRDLGLADKQEIGGAADSAPMTMIFTPVESGTFLPPINEDGTLPTATSLAALAAETQAPNLE